MHVDTPAARAFRAGDFLKAQRLLQHSDDLDSVVLRAEVSYFVGDVAEAAHAVRVLIKDSRLTPSQQSRCWAVLAQCEHDSGAPEEALLGCQRALELAERARDAKQIAASLTQLLERGCDSIGFRAS